MKLRIISILILLILFIYFIPSLNAAVGGGSAPVPVSTIDLSEEGNNYSMKPGRLKFEFNNEWYAIQLRRVKNEYVTFIVMDLDESDLKNITAYKIIEGEFNLYPEESKKIDLNGDNINEIVIKLDETIYNVGSTRSAGFSIKKLINSNLTVAFEESKNIEELEKIETENNNILNKEPQEEVLVNNKKLSEEKEVINITLSKTQELEEESTDLTFVQKLISWFKNLF